MDFEGCDTAFIFDPSQRVDPVLTAMREGELVPVETRFSTEGAADGTTGGSVGSPGRPGTIDNVESALEMGAEMHGVEPLIIGIRVSGVVETSALGELEAKVHSRMLVPSAAAIALSPPDVGDGDTVNVVGGGSCS